MVVEVPWKNNKKTGDGRCVLKDSGSFQCSFKDDIIESGQKLHEGVDIGRLRKM